MDLYIGTSTPVPQQFFECPNCGTCHKRGQLGEPGSGIYRCLKCGYVGRGYHPDPEIDAEIAKDALEGERADILAGIGPWVGIPPEPSPIGYKPTEDDIYQAEQRGIYG